MKKVNIKKYKRLIAWILIIITVVTQVNFPSISDIANLVYAKETKQNNELNNGEASTEDITEASIEDLEEEQTCDVIGYAVYMGEDEISLEDMELILCVDGINQLDIKPTFVITDDFYEGFPMWKYSFYDLPQYDENDNLINYSI